MEKALNSKPTIYRNSLLLLEKNNFILSRECYKQTGNNLLILICVECTAWVEAGVLVGGPSQI